MKDIGRGTKDHGNLRGLKETLRNVIRYVVLCVKFAVFESNIGTRMQAELKDSTHQGTREAECGQLTAREVGFQGTPEA